MTDDEVRNTVWTQAPPRFRSLTAGELECAERIAHGKFLRSLGREQEGYAATLAIISHYRELLAKKEDAHE